MSSYSLQNKLQIWQDRLICFDTLMKSSFGLVPGEFQVYSASNIHDLKGLSISDGVMTVTNLRINWYSSRFNNLIIGLNTIVSVTMRQAIPGEDNLRAGKTHSQDCMSIFVMAEDTEARYLFAFTEKQENSQVMESLFSIIENTLKAYRASLYYRDLRVRTFLVQRAGQPLQPLPRETVFDRIKNVWHIADGEGHVGQLYLTNFRFVWLSSLNDYFNASIPYLQLNGLSKIDTRYGKALVLQLSEYGDGLRLGFRIDPQDLLDGIADKVISYHRMFQENPFYGLQVVDDDDDNKGHEIIDNNPKNNEVAETGESDQDNDDDETNNDKCNPNEQEKGFLASKYMVESRVKEDENFRSSNIVVYDDLLGLAIEKLPDGVSSLGELISFDYSAD